MRLPGFMAEAGLDRPTRQYNSAGTITVARPRAGVEMAIIPGGCDPNGSYGCDAAWDTCQYYAGVTSHSGADVSGCCTWWVDNCETHPPQTGGGGGGGGGGAPPHRGPVVF
jgi:hypothetical protein